MKKILRWIAILIILIINIIPVTPVLADSSVDVSVIAHGTTSAGIINFTITYISDQQLKLDWGYVGNVTAIMIRAKYGQYPVDISSSNETPSDGYFVYSGNGTSTNDTSMDFDENPGAIFYKAWGQYTDGSWQLIPQKGNKESRAMAFLGLIALAGILTFVAVKSPFRLFSLLAGAAWIVLMLYTKGNPPGNLVEGSAAHTGILVLLIGIGIGVPVYALGREVQTQRDWRTNDQTQSKIFSRWNLGLKDIGKDKEKMSATMMRRQKLSEYREQVHRSLFQEERPIARRRR